MDAMLTCSALGTNSRAASTPSINSILPLSFSVKNSLSSLNWAIWSQFNKWLFSHRVLKARNCASSPLKREKCRGENSGPPKPFTSLPRSKYRTSLVSLHLDERGNASKFGTFWLQCSSFSSIFERWAKGLLILSSSSSYDWCPAEWQSSSPLDCMLWRCWWLLAILY